MFVDVLGSLTSTDDVVTPLDAGRVVLEHLGGVLLAKPEAVQEVAEIQDIHAGC